MRERLPLAKDLTTSIDPRFHVMVVNGQPKKQNLNRKRGAKK
jgi:hypothetical protein